MGNCIKKESSMQWGGDDWSDDYSPANSADKKMNSYGPNHEYYDDEVKEEKARSLATNDDNLKEPKQVKLKITRKQLEQVLELTKTNIQGVSVEQVLAQLINGTGINDSQSHQTRSWRPDLPTIKEI